MYDLTKGPQLVLDNERRSQRPVHRCQFNVVPTQGETTSSQCRRKLILGHFARHAGQEARFNSKTTKDHRADTVLI